MILGIDATNISSGGGLNHLKKVLENIDPQQEGFDKVVIWGSTKTLGQLVNAKWLEKQSSNWLNKNLFFRSLWKMIYLNRALKTKQCDILFAPGGSYIGGFHPVVTMSRNMLPFEWKEMKRFGLSFIFIKLLALRFVQSLTYKLADGIIFLTQYAQTTVLEIVGSSGARTTIIPHGVNQFFVGCSGYLERSVESSSNSSIHILYVSIIDMYKHQWNILRAVSELRKQGYKVTVEFVGPAKPAALKVFNRTIKELDEQQNQEFNKKLNKGLNKELERTPDSTQAYCTYSGNIQNDKLPEYYKKADICVFASTCENMPNILLEGMATGLPMACSNKQPMPEILQQAGLYFDPENVSEIITALKKYLDSEALRKMLAAESSLLAEKYSWEETATKTFRFLYEIGKSRNNVHVP